jgi:phthalate 4,5-dioxygenase
MLTKEENDLLTQTGPGTPGGALLRSYWQPGALSEELPPDGVHCVFVCWAKIWLCSETIRDGPDS